MPTITQTLEKTRLINALVDILNFYETTPEGQDQIRQKGIFRLSGREDQYNSALEQLTRGKADFDEVKKNLELQTNDIASLFKSIIRTLKDKYDYELISSEQWQHLEKLTANGDDANPDAVKIIGSNYLLYRLCSLGANIASKVQSNSMTAANIATCWTLNLITEQPIDYNSVTAEEAQALMKRPETINAIFANNFLTNFDGEVGFTNDADPVYVMVKVKDALSQAQDDSALIRILYNEINRLEHTDKGSAMINAVSDLINQADDEVSLEDVVQNAIMDRGSELSNALNTHRSSVLKFTFLGERSAISSDTRSYQRLLKMAEGNQLDNDHVPLIRS